MSFDAVLYATGRKSNITDLGLENTDIVVTDHGAIEVDDYCETSVPNVYAVGMSMADSNLLMCHWTIIA